MKTLPSFAALCALSLCAHSQDVYVDLQPSGSGWRRAGLPGVWNPVQATGTTGLVSATGAPTSVDLDVISFASSTFFSH
ncbi:MAG: hypothetical protein IPJ19_16725 [Planctomycetes bacterium]|nr:hypothetical protein [Planctomycetota bacterium]